MKKPILITLLASSAIMLAAGAAQAQPGRGHDGHGRGGPGRGGMEQGMMMLRVADANGDNSITRAEVDALRAEMFEWMDRNGDGYLDGDDQSPVHQRMRAMRDANPDRADRADRANRPEGEGRRGSRRGGGDRGERGLRGADTDGDNRVSRAEYLGAEHRGFARLDQDSDGVIAPEELDASVERRHDRRRWWRN